MYFMSYVIKYSMHYYTVLDIILYTIIGLNSLPNCNKLLETFRNNS